MSIRKRSRIRESAAFSGVKTAHDVRRGRKERAAVVASPESTNSVFDEAAEVFDGWTDADTGRRVLRIHTRGPGPGGSIWGTQYHQFRCFLDGRRRVLLHRSTPTAAGSTTEYFLLDLTTGEMDSPFPSDCMVNDVSAATGYACYQAGPAGAGRAAIWDMRTGEDVASMTCDGWILNCIGLLADGRRAMAFFYHGTRHRGHVVSRHYLLGVDQEPEIVLEADGFFCSHIQQCPTDPDLYSYDRWPSPTTEIDQVLRLRRLDGSYDEPVPLNAQAVRPAMTLGARDHYVWTPDGNRIVSYLCVDPFEPYDPKFDHYRLQWWLSATDWRTGEDFGVPYPKGRWGAHMQITPDSRHIISGGAPGFDHLLAIDIEGLRDGWNERVICDYPHTQEVEDPYGPFPYPFVLPDQSGVIFNAGWPGPEHGVYLAEWPSDW